MKIIEMIDKNGDVNFRENIGERNFDVNGRGTNETSKENDVSTTSETTFVSSNEKHDTKVVPEILNNKNNIVLILLIVVAFIFFSK